MPPLSRAQRALANEGSAKNPPKGKFVEGVFMSRLKPRPTRLPRAATLREKILGEFLRNSRKGGARLVVETGRCGSGRSKQRPYGVLVRQYASGSRKREQAPALHRNVAALNLEIGG